MNKEPSIHGKSRNIDGLLSFIAEGLVVFDHEGRIITLNPHASLLLDYTADELIGKKFDDIISIYIGNDLISKNNCITRSVSEGKTFSSKENQTLYFEASNGKRFPVFASAKPLLFYDKDKEIDGGVLVFRDVTIEKELERYKEVTAKTLSELTPVLQKTSIGDFTHYPKLPKEENEFTELLVGLRLMLDDLKELDLKRVKNEQENLKTIEEKRQLTEKYSKELEQEVERKTEELSGAKKHIETVIESLTNGLIEYNSDGEVIRLNKAAENLLGVSKEHVIGKQIYEGDKKLITLSSITAVTFPELCEEAKSINRDVSGLDADVYELTIAYPNEKDLQIATVPVSGQEQDGSKGTLKIIRDVTREKLISRSKSEFISIAAHQLRTPLSAVKWALSLVLNGDSGRLNEEQIKIITQTYETNDKMISLVNDFLNVARIENGRFGYEFKKDNFSLLVEKITSVSGLHAKQKGIEFSFLNKSKEILEFVFDLSKISVAIQNLVDNAIKYTPVGGTVQVVLSLDEKFAKVEVTDSGVGVPKQQVARLFTKFFRAENVIKLPVSGSGLGLFITRNIIVRHGGDIKVHSVEGKGTTFTMAIPIDEKMIPEKDDIASSLYV